MTDADDAIEAFLDSADDVFGEYDQGYIDADAALRQLRSHVSELESAQD